MTQSSHDNSPEEDSDLVDLLRSGGANHATQQMNLDHLTTTGIRVSPRNAKQRQQNRQSQMSCCDFITSYTAMLCHYYPKCCACVLTAGVVIVLLLLTNVVFNPVQSLGVLDEHAVFNIHSKYDLTIGQVDHWCLRGGNERCRCEDPLQPLGRIEHLSWLQAVKANRALVETAATHAVDVAILGESVVEAMGGRWMGQTRSAQMGQLGNLFQRKFNNTSDKNGISGVALGIAGDTAPNVLWRLLHGEMPPQFQPKIWWISLGMNDLARMQCSEEIVVLGILRVVEEIMEQRPYAHIVINSVLPMANVRGGAYPLVTDYSEALLPPRQKRQLEEEDEFDLLVPSLLQRQLKRKGKKDADAAPKPETIKDPKQREKAMMEKAEQAEEQRAKKNKKRRRKEPVNAKLDTRQKVRKFPVGAKVFDKIPMWTSIQAINRQLRKFSEMPEHKKRIHFYDATDLFVDRSNGKARVKSNRITLTGYPRLAGFEMWEDAILDFSKPILEDMKATHPELFGLSGNEIENDDDDTSLEDDDLSSIDDDGNE